MLLFEHIKVKDNILIDSILYLRSMQLYNPWDLEGEGKQFKRDIFEEFPFIEAKVNMEKNPVQKDEEMLPQVEQHNITTQEIQHVSLKFDSEELPKLQEANPQYA